MSPQERKMERVQQPRGQGEGRRGATAGWGHQTVTDALGGARPTGTGDWKEPGRRQSRKKQGRGQATKTGTYLRRGLGEGGPRGGRARRLGLMVDSDLGGGSRGAIRRLMQTLFIILLLIDPQPPPQSEWKPIESECFRAFRFLTSSIVIFMQT